jgi:hypothetical protein
VRANTPILNKIINCLTAALDDAALNSCIANNPKLSRSSSGLSFSQHKQVLVATFTASRDCYLESTSQEAFNTCRQRSLKALNQRFEAQKASQSTQQTGGFAPVKSAKAVSIAARAICLYTIANHRPTSTGEFANHTKSSTMLFVVSNQPEKNGGNISSEFRKAWLAANNGNESLAKENLNSYYAWRSTAHIKDFKEAVTFSMEKDDVLIAAVYKRCPTPAMK